MDPRALNMFVTCLLLLRDKSPVDEAELNAFDGGGLELAVHCLEPWVRYCLSWKARKLCVSSNDDEVHWLLPKGLITSAHKDLTVLELTRVRWVHDLDFSGCVKLEDLKLEFCDIYGDKIISPSLKHLSIIVCSFDEDVRARITVPNLISLLMVDCTEMTPSFESMPFLVDACVRLQHCDDICRNNYEAGDCGDESCVGCSGIKYGQSGSCVLLEAFSSATKLELTSSPEVFIFRRDLTQCPIFNNLKTLLLNEWCLTATHDALLCFLQHSPVLEKLILQFNPNHSNLMEMSASYDLKKQPLKDLALEVKCVEGDDRIRGILEFFCSYDLPLEKIKIKHIPQRHSESFSFEQKT